MQAASDGCSSFHHCYTSIRSMKNKFKNNFVQKVKASGIIFHTTIEFD